MENLYLRLQSYYLRIVWKYRRTLSKNLYCKKVRMEEKEPIISFSFDDAPHTAFINGGKIAKKYGGGVTFYVSLGILESQSSSGPIASIQDLRHAVKEGHELGCHTFDHKHSWETKTENYLQSVIKNHQVLSMLIPETKFSSFAYPICGPKPSIKRKIGKIFRCSRGGGQTLNFGNIDLNLLKAYFLDNRNGDKIEAIKKIIDMNAETRGWLIFATHDVDEKPSKYGISNDKFEDVVKYAAQSGALLLPVGKACERVLFKVNK